MPLSVTYPTTAKMPIPVITEAPALPRLDRPGPSPAVTDNASYVAYAPAVRIGRAAYGALAGSVLAAVIWVPYPREVPPRRGDLRPLAAC